MSLRLELIEFLFGELILLKRVCILDVELLVLAVVLLSKNGFALVLSTFPAREEQFLCLRVLVVDVRADFQLACSVKTYFFQGKSVADLLVDLAFKVAKFLLPILFLLVK